MKEDPQSPFIRFWDEISARLKVGDVVIAQIELLTHFGVFVLLEEGGFPEPVRA